MSPGPVGTAGGLSLPVLFAVTLLVSSALLFLVQPMFAKMVLPYLGGTPAVWNTCMVFFQAALLAGYAYAHLAPRLSRRAHLVLHLVLLVLPFLVLPLAVRDSRPPTGDINPVPWLLGVLTMSVGLPFLVVSTHGPLLQRWFADSRHFRARDPYFLYSASNVGSMAALLAYPFLVEPSLALPEQGRLWTVGYVVLACLAAACALAVWKPAPARAPAKGKAPPAPPPVQVDGRTRLRWLLLSFVPSSLMLSVTTYLTTDIAAVPLLWVVPLAVYLLTFTLAFAQRQILPHGLVLRVMPFIILLLTLVMLTQATEPVWVLLPLHLVAFFVIALACHGTLAAGRPAAARLTEFYLWLAVGGVLGGAFNALVAPVVFNGVYEFPLALVVAALMRPSDRTSLQMKWSRVFLLDIGLAVGLGILTAGLVLLVQRVSPGHGSGSVLVMFGIPAVICYTFLNHPLRFGLGIAALFLAGALYAGVYGGTVFRARSFFGVHRVTQDEAGAEYRLVHGNTVHGRQFRDPQRRGEPLSYYHRSGPIGHVFERLGGVESRPAVAVVGLGAGSLAAYAARDQEMAFYEIDPVVERLAQDPTYFTFYRDAHDRGARVSVVLGDARLTLQSAPKQHYGLLVMDAFSSDAIPLHLLTREALQVYRDRLTPDGVLAVNVSNRYLDLGPVLAALARDARLACRFWFDLVDADDPGGKSSSQWMVMGTEEALNRLAPVEENRWQRAEPPRGTPVWTDTYSNLWSVFNWK